MWAKVIKVHYLTSLTAYDTLIGFVFTLYSFSVLTFYFVTTLNLLLDERAKRYRYYLVITEKIFVCVHYVSDHKPTQWFGRLCPICVSV